MEILIWNRRTPQPKANPTQEKLGQKWHLGHFFSHSNYFFVGWDWFYIGKRLQETQPNRFLRKHPNVRMVGLWTRLEWEVSTRFSLGMWVAWNPGGWRKLKRDTQVTQAAAAYVGGNMEVVQCGAPNPSSKSPFIPVLRRDTWWSDGFQVCNITRVDINQDLIWCVKIGVYMGFWVHHGFWLLLITYAHP